MGELTGTNPLPAGPRGRGSVWSSGEEPWGSAAGPASQPGADRCAPDPTWSAGPGRRWRRWGRRLAEERVEGACPETRGQIFIHYVAMLTHVSTIHLCAKLQATKYAFKVVLWSEG